MTRLAVPPRDVRTIVNDAAFVLGIVDASTMPESELAEVAFAGRSNVGKSTLLNVLTGRKNLARTSSTPGCTRQINVFEIRFGDGVPMRLVDLPGFGYAKRSKQERVQWGDLIEGYLRDGRRLAALVLLVDVRRGLEDEELQLLDFLREVRGEAFPCLVVVTKTDKVSRSEARLSVDAVSRVLKHRAVSFSAQSGDGRDELWLTIRRLALPAAPGAARPAKIQAGAAAPKRAEAARPKPKKR